MFPPQNAVVVNVVVERASGGIAVGDVIIMHRDKKFYKHTDEVQQYTTQVTGVCITPRTEVRGGVSVCVRGLITINVEDATQYAPAAPYTINEYLVLGRVVSRIERDSVPGLPRSERHALRVFVSPELLSRYDAGRAALRWERFLNKPALIAAREAVRTATDTTAADAAVGTAVETLVRAATLETARTPVRSTGDPGADLATIASDAKQLLREKLEPLKTLNSSISVTANTNINTAIGKGGDISGTPSTEGAPTTTVRNTLFAEMAKTHVTLNANAEKILIEWNEVFNKMVDMPAIADDKKAWAMYDVIKATVPTLGLSLAKWLSPNGFIARKAKARTDAVLNDHQANDIETAGTWANSKFQYLNIELNGLMEPWVNGIYEVTPGLARPEWRHVGWGHNVKLCLVDDFICFDGETSKYTKDKDRQFKFLSVGKKSSFIEFFKEKDRCTAFVLNKERSTLSPIIITEQKYNTASKRLEIANAKKIPVYTARTRDNYFEGIDFTRLNGTNQNDVSEIIDCSDFLGRLEVYLDTIHVLGIHCCTHILEKVQNELQKLKALDSTAQCAFALDATRNDRLKTFVSYSTLPRNWNKPYGTSRDWLSSASNANPLALTDVDTMMKHMEPAVSSIDLTTKRVTIYTTDSIDYTIPLGLYDCNADGVYQNVADPSFKFNAQGTLNFDDVEYTVNQNGKVVSTVEMVHSVNDNLYEPMETHFATIFNNAVVTSTITGVDPKTQTIRVEYVREMGPTYVYVSIRDPHENKIMSTFVLDLDADPVKFLKMVESTYEALSTERVTLVPDDENPSEIHSGMLLVYYTEPYLRVVLKDGNDNSIVEMGLRSDRMANFTANRFARSLGTKDRDKFPGANTKKEATEGVHVFYDTDVDIFKLELYNIDNGKSLKKVEYSSFSNETIDTIANRELIKDDKAIFRLPGVKGTETTGNYTYYNKPVICLFGISYYAQHKLPTGHQIWWTERSQKWYYEQRNFKKYCKVIPAPDDWHALNDYLKQVTTLKKFTVLDLPTEQSTKDDVLAQLKEGSLFVPIMKPAPPGTALGFSASLEASTSSTPPLAVVPDVSLEGSVEASFQETAFDSRKRAKTATKATGGGRGNRSSSTAARRSIRESANRRTGSDGKQ